VKSSSSQLRKLPGAVGSSLKREAASPASGIGLVLKKPRLASQTFTPLGRAIEADRRASPTTQVYLYEEIATEGLVLLMSYLPAVDSSSNGVPRRQPHRRSGLATLPSVGAVP